LYMLMNEMASIMDVCEYFIPIVFVF
jgi:hypothetical protein